MKEENIIFLISQPRSGSSMVQQLILNCDKITSAPEPWQMLSLIYAFKIDDIEEGYNPRFASINFNRFLESIEDGMDKFKSSLREIALNNYQSVLGGKEYFLDKTPRYYHVIDELMELLPRAKFIFLVRNPVSVFASILDYYFQGDIINFLKSHDRIQDLVVAPRKILNASNNNPNCFLIYYEELVDRPLEIIRSVFKYLELPEPNEINYKITGSFVDSKAVDTKSLQKHSQPVSDYLESWKNSIDTSQKKTALLGYLKFLEKEFPDYFNYDLESWIDQLIELRPKRKSRFNLSYKVLTSREEEMSILGVIKKRVYLKLQRTLFQ